MRVVLTVSCVGLSAEEEPTACAKALGAAEVDLPYSKSAVRTGETYIGNLVSLSHMSYLRARFNYVKGEFIAHAHACACTMMRKHAYR